MGHLKLATLAVVLTPPSLTGQQNPFTMTGGTVKSAHVVYEMRNKGKPVPGASVEIAVAGERLGMQLVAPFDTARKLVARVLVIETGDSSYRFDDGQGQVTPTLRPHLIREYAALDAAAKARLRQNLKLFPATIGWEEVQSDLDHLLPFFGEKVGSETIAGQRCDVYRRGQLTVCVLPQAPMLPLRATGKDGNGQVARTVSLNAKPPPGLTTLPKGVRWKKEQDLEDAGLARWIWETKKQTDPTMATPAALAHFALRYLSSPQATKELPEMEAENQGEEPEPEDGGEN